LAACSAGELRGARGEMAGDPAQIADALRFVQLREGAAAAGAALGDAAEAEALREAGEAGEANRRFLDDKAAQELLAAEPFGPQPFPRRVLGKRRVLKDAAGAAGKAPKPAKKDPNGGGVLDPNGGGGVVKPGKPAAPGAGGAGGDAGAATGDVLQTQVLGVPLVTILEVAGVAIVGLVLIKFAMRRRAAAAAS
jgi:hypothetical protein